MRNAFLSPNNLKFAGFEFEKMRGFLFELLDCNVLPSVLISSFVCSLINVSLNNRGISLNV